MATGTDVTVGGASLSVLSGAVGMDDLAIGNPEGFTAGHAFEVGSIDVATELRSLMSDTIEIPSIEIQSPVITLEMNQGGTNLGALMERLEKASGGGRGGSSGSGDGSGKQMHIGRLTIQGAKVNLVQSALLKGGTTLELPDLTMEDIGGADESVGMAELIETVLGMILTGVSGAGVEGQLRAMLDKELAGLDDVRKQLEGSLKELQSTGDELKKAGEEAAGKIKEGLGGLLGGDDK